LSTAEAEYVALSEACQELTWLRKLLGEFGETLGGATTLFEDNQSTLKMIHNGKWSNRTKHMDLKYHFIKDLHEKKVVDFKYCPSSDMAADLLTKPIKATRIIELRRLIGLH
jgi:hypothetical protein